MKIDLSDAAITRRLKQVEQLRQLCLSLSKAQKVKTLDKTPPKVQNPKSKIQN